MIENENYLAKHQRQFAKTARPYEGLWHGTGCAKTRTALHTVQDYDGSILVIAPKTTVHKQQWQYEAKVLGMKAPTVISKETFRRDHQILNRFRVVIVDEAHCICGMQPNTRRINKREVPKTSQLYDSVLWYITNHRPERLILSTATPNKTPMSVYAASVLLGHKWDFYDFRSEFYTILPMDLPWGQVVYAPRRTKIVMDALAERTRELGQVLRLEDLKDIPEQTYRTVEFELTAQQKKQIELLPSMFTGDATLRGKRHQIENGILYSDVFDPKTNRIIKKTQRFDNAKLDYILERADEFEKMVIFANYTEQVNMIADALRKEGKENVFVMDSSTKDRKAVETQAEKLQSAYIVAQASVSSEWEYKSAPVVIFASLSNKSLDYIQGKGRVQRYDKVKKNLYIHLKTTYKGSIDAKWFDTIMSGRDFNEALFDK
jgi:hypothetical protein